MRAQSVCAADQLPLRSSTPVFAPPVSVPGLVCSCARVTLRYVEPSGPLSATVLSRTTSWHAPLQTLLALNGSSHAANGSAAHRGGTDVGNSGGNNGGNSGGNGGAALNAREAAIYDLVSGFVSDLECGIVYSASEHMATQISFLTSGDLERGAHLDVQIRLSNISADLERLGKLLRYSPPNDARPVSNSSVWKCALGTENVADAKAKLVISKED
eukprot:2704700-Pleurochrysis_carterae.AAC.1